MAPCSTLPKQSRSDCFASLRRVTCKRPFANAACHSQRGVEFSPLGNRIRQQYWRRFTILASITVHPDRISEAALARVDVVIATGESAIESLRVFARMRQMNEPPQPS